MKRLTFVLAMLVCGLAHAGFLGFLVHSEQTWSLTHQMIYKCTYKVNNTLQTVLLQNICPPSMEFQ